MAYSRGKYAKSISDRSGMEFPYNEMVKEWELPLKAESIIGPDLKTLNGKLGGNNVRNRNFKRG